MYRSFSEAERRFNEAGTMFHLSTEPIADNVVFTSEADYIIANNLIALAISCSNCVLLAMAIMSNHLHFILEGTREDCLAFYEDLRNRLKKVFIRGGKGGIIARMNPGLVPIENLRQLLDEIAYVIRNPFVARTDVNPLAYRWCSGFLYFSSLLDDGGTPASRLRGRALREFTHSKADVIPTETILIKDGVANPASFIDYRRAESFFDNARHFVMKVFKNVEGQIEAAARHGELPHLNDEEMFGLSCKICRSIFRVNSPKELTEDRKKKLALRLKNEYGASNGQIARCANLPLAIVNDMFPLSTPRKS